jgi:hypothetical protein
MESSFEMRFPRRETWPPVVRHHSRALHVIPAASFDDSFLTEYFNHLNEVLRVSAGHARYAAAQPAGPALHPDEQASSARAATQTQCIGEK